jgi:hypothetical protein
VWELNAEFTKLGRDEFELHESFAHFFIRHLEKGRKLLDMMWIELI